MPAPQQQKAVDVIMARFKSEGFPQPSDDAAREIFEKAIHWRMRQYFKARRPKSQGVASSTPETASEPLDDKDGA